MNRAQCIVYRGNHILMVKHRMHGEEWWCLPGGGVEPFETPAEAVVRELEEECSVRGSIVRQTSHTIDAEGMQTITFLVEIGHQEPRMGADPEFAQERQILVDMQWLALSEIPERDRAYLWAAGIMNIPVFLKEVSQWGEAISYPVEKT